MPSGIPKNGINKGWFKKGNKPWLKGKKMTEEQKAKLDMSGLELGRQDGEKHHNWKGDQVSYGSLHKWLVRHKGNALECENCGLKGRKRKGRWNIHWASSDGKYPRKLNHYLGLCYPCHGAHDSILRRL